MPNLEVHGVSKRFGTRIVLDALEFRVSHGAGLGLFGPSGCGKTTVLRLLAGLERADSGAIVLDGVDVNATCSGRRNGCQIGMVFQDLALWPHMHAERHLEFVLRGRGIGRRDRIMRAREMLDFSGLGDKRHAYPATLSGGEQQRLAIARALVTNPELLLLDEPFANLDDALRARFHEEFVRRKSNQKTTIVMTSHDRRDLEGVVDDILLLTVCGQEIKPKLSAKAR